jgi:hypothetical protein
MTNTSRTNITSLAQKTRHVEYFGLTIMFKCERIDEWAFGLIDENLLAVDQQCTLMNNKWPPFVEPFLALSTEL